tara:strand:- start:100 stop:558 length:459 start_codon:yes stop_codon:yes gene_type:complete
MNKYRNGKIYKLIDLTNDNIYIGSTIEKLDRRLKRHIYYIKEDRLCASRSIILNGEYKIQLIKSYPCNSNRALEKEEQRYIDMYDCVNICNSYSTEEQNKQSIKNWHIKNKEYTHNKYKTPIMCECGSVYSHRNGKRHMKSKKHINYLLECP